MLRYIVATKRTSGLTKATNCVLIVSIDSSKYLNSGLVSKTRISITDFDDFFTRGTFSKSSAAMPFAVESEVSLWTDFWSPARTVDQWLWVFLTLMSFAFGSHQDVGLLYESRVNELSVDCVNMKRKNVSKMLVRSMKINWRTYQFLMDPFCTFRKKFKVRVCMNVQNIYDLCLQQCTNIDPLFMNLLNPIYD